VSSSDSVPRFKIKRILDLLASKEGRGTELISIYVPPNKKIHEVMNNLRQEYGTASNIKSRTTRKNVQDSIERVSQRLKLFKNPPKNGLVIFCGAIPQNGIGSEKMEMYALEPPEPIHVYFYRCDNRFHTEPLLEIMREKETYGILVVDSNDSVLATLHGRRMEVLKEYHSGVGGKHKTGGQSARRFERIREQALNDYFKRVGSHANGIFSQIPDLRGIIIGGPGATKYEFSEGEYLNYILKQKIIGVVDTSYVGANGVEEVVAKSPEILRGVRYSDEKRAVQSFLYQVGHDTGQGVYGETEVRKYLKLGIVDMLLLSEKVNVVHVETKCSSCGYVEDRLMATHELMTYEQSMADVRCPKCSNNTLVIEKRDDLLDELIELGDKAGAKIEIVSVETEEGVMLRGSFGGIAATLRYKPT
jgi:peptide chain release factor subunit 1